MLSAFARMATRRSLLPLSIVIPLSAILLKRTSAFCVAPSVEIPFKKHGTPIGNTRAPRRFVQQNRPRPSPFGAATTRLLQSYDDFPDTNAEEQEMANLSRTPTDQSTSPNEPEPLFGEIAVDGSLVVLIPAAVISILGFVVSVVIAFNAGDAFVEEIQLSETEDAPTVVENGATCRGLCSSQEEELDGLRNFMQGISGKD